MKTSTTQFELLVNFMEDHGDISKPSTKTAHGRIQAIRHWERLTNLLNADSTGTIKTTEKWKKVWSDMKNNTKKKAAKISKAACGTGGGPALQAKLSELEQRILTVLGGYQAAVGLRGVDEAGFTQNLHTARQQDREHDSNRTLTLSSVVGDTVDSPSIFNAMDIQQQIELALITSQVAGPSHMFLPMNIHTAADSTPPPQASSPLISTTPFPSPPPMRAAPGSAMPDAQPITPPLRIEEPTTSPLRTAPHSTPPWRTPEAPTPPPRGGYDSSFRVRRGQMPGRGRVPTTRRIAVSPRRQFSRPQSHVQQAAQHFLNSDESWRNFLIKQHEDTIDIQRHKIRVEERWQEIATQAIAALNRILDSRL